MNSTRYTVVVLHSSFSNCSAVVLVLVSQRNSSSQQLLSPVLVSQPNSSSQQAASGAATDLEYTVLLPRCRSRCDTSWIFAKIVHDTRVLQSLRSHQVSLLRFQQQVFFLNYHQSYHFWNLITEFYEWFLAHQRGSVLGYSSSLCISYPSQARFWTDRYDLLQ